ncbi:hypothetical protein BDP27DRAFT_1336400, partial [Rhodocollybia butyracea]
MKLMLLPLACTAVMAYPSRKNKGLSNDARIDPPMNENQKEVAEKPHSSQFLATGDSTQILSITEDLIQTYLQKDFASKRQVSCDEDCEF